MGIGDYIILGILVVIVVAIIGYLIKQKKSGVKCIGCPHGKSCQSKKSGCSCCNNNQTK